MYIKSHHNLAIVRNIDEKCVCNFRTSGTNINTELNFIFLDLIVDALRNIDFFIDDLIVNILIFYKCFFQIYS